MKRLPDYRKMLHVLPLDVLGIQPSMGRQRGCAEGHYSREGRSQESEMMSCGVWLVLGPICQKTS